MISWNTRFDRPRTSHSYPTFPASKLDSEKPRWSRRGAGRPATERRPAGFRYARPPALPRWTQSHPASRPTPVEIRRTARAGIRRNRIRRVTSRCRRFHQMNHAHPSLSVPGLVGSFPDDHDNLRRVASYLEIDAIPSHLVYGRDSVHIVSPPRTSMRSTSKHPPPSGGDSVEPPDASTSTRSNNREWPSRIH